MQEVVVNLMKIKFDRVGMMKLIYPFIISTSEISTAFVYDLFEGKFINAPLVDHNKKLVFELEPNDHVAFTLTCDRSECLLKVYDIHVKTELRNYDGYEQYETDDVKVSEVYSAILDRDIFRSISNCKDTPNILSFILAYLVPLNLPDVYYSFLNANEIVEELKKFFES